MNRYRKKSQPSLPEEGVIASSGQRMDVLGKEGVRQVRCVLPCGMEAFPAEGDPVILLTLDSGEVVVLGTAQVKSEKEGEIGFRAKSGAYLQLKSDGTVVINGMVIGTDGTILQKGENTGG